MPRPAPLTDSEEESLAARVAAGDRAARDELVLRHQWIVAGLARRVRGRAYLDAEADGLLALVETANGFRPGVGRFEDVAARAIRRAIGKGRRRWGRLRATVPLDAVPERAARSDGPPDRHRRVAVAIATALSEREREAVRVRYGLDRPQRRSNGSRSAELEAAEARLRKALAGEES